MSNMKNWCLYVLKLEQGKWYVGITSQTPEARMLEHKNKKRAAYWTMKYPPIEIIETEYLGTITKEEAETRENAVVRTCIKKNGINNVRGGDLKDTSDYIIVFGTIYDKEGFKDAVTVMIIITLLILFVTDKYISSFIPGGLR